MDSTNSVLNARLNKTIINSDGVSDLNTMIERLLELNACNSFSVLKKFVVNSVLPEIGADYLCVFRLNPLVSAEYAFCCELSAESERLKGESRFFETFVEHHVRQQLQEGQTDNQNDRQFVLYEKNLMASTDPYRDRKKWLEESSFSCFNQTSKAMVLLDYPINSTCLVVGRYLDQTFGESQQKFIRALQPSLQYCISAIDRNRTLQKIRQAGVSERELQVLMLLGKAMTNREIAESLNLSENTVRFHVKNLHKKLGTARRTELVLMC